MGTIKIKVGSLTLTEARDECLPQEFAAWHQTVRIEPGTYDVFACIEQELGDTYRVRSLFAACEGITVSSNFRSHVLGTWGQSDNNRNGQRAYASICLPTYGTVTRVQPLLAQVTLCDALIRTEWDPSDTDPSSITGRMWRFTWNTERKPLIIERPRYGGGLSVAAFEDHRRFSVDDVEISPGELAARNLAFQHLYTGDQLGVGETAVGWSWQDKQSVQVTRLA